jgi:hypothetical protein
MQEWGEIKSNKCKNEAEKGAKYDSIGFRK